MNETLIYQLFILALSVFLGFALISKVPPLLHTPLMSEANAICGIILVGALIAAGVEAENPFSIILGTSAVALATFNVVGGYMVTERMLKMFKKKEPVK
jgi:NAD(P) transhydrogenase subunit alpha